MRHLLLAEENIVAGLEAQNREDALKKIVGALPAASNFEGRTVYLTTDNKIYRWTDAVVTTGTTYWSAAVATADLSGTVDLATQVSGTLTTAFAAAGLINSNVTVNANGTLTGAGGGQVSLTSLPGTIAAGQIAANAVTAAAIMAGEVTAGKIAAGSIATDRMTANTINGDRISAGTLDASKIVADSITAGQIAAGAISASEIAAGAVTTSKLAVGDFTVLNRNWDFEEGNISWTNSANVSIVSDGANAKSGTYVLRNTSLAAMTSRNTQIIPALPGETFYAEAYIKHAAASTGTGMYVSIVYLDSVGAELTPSNGNTVTAATTAYTKSSILGTAPANTTDVLIGIGGTLTAGTGYVDEVRLFRATTSTLIADGAITTAKMTAGTINANILTAGSITATEIGANAVTANKILAGEITAAKMAANVLISDSVLTRGIMVRNMSGYTLLDAGGTGAAVPPWVVNGSTVGGGVELTTGATPSNTMELRSLAAGGGIDISVNDVGAIVIGAMSATRNAVQLAADQASSTTVVASCTGMQLALEANKTYMIRGVLRMRSAATTTGIRIGYVVPTGTNIVMRINGSTTATATNTKTINVAPSGSVALAGSFASTDGTNFSSTADSIVALDALLTVGSTAGSFQLQMASEVNASAVTLRAGSYMYIDEAPAVLMTATGLAAAPAYPSTRTAEKYTVAVSATASNVVTLKSDGTWGVSSTGFAGATGNWSATPAAGVGVQWYVKFVPSSGTLTSNAAAAYALLSSDKACTLTSTAAVGNVTSKSVTVTIWMKNAATGVETSTGSIALTSYAEADYSGGGGCPLCCFSPGTLIAMADIRYKKIEDIVVGDRILTDQGEEVVTEIIVREERAMFRLEFDDGKVVEASDDHPFYVIGRGYSSLNPTVPYKDIGVPSVMQVGDSVATLGGGSARLLSATPIACPSKVYTLAQSGFYANGLLVY